MEGFLEQGAKENVLTYDRESRRFKKVAWGASLLIDCCKYQIKEGNLRNAYRIKGRDQSWVPGIEGRKILKKGKGARGRESEDVVCSCLTF